MALRRDAEGETTDEVIHEYDWKDAVLYALGVGARTAELDYLYEKRGPRVLPTYAVIPAFETTHRLFDILGGNLLGVVHGGQRIRVHRPLPPRGRLRTIGRIARIYDLKRMAQAVLTTETRDQAGQLLAETEWTVLFRLDGGFGGQPPPRSEKVRPPDREPDFRVEDPTSEEQALLYRLNGDLNPLHADPEIGEKAGFGKPILHGLCTFGYVGRAVLQQCCGSDPARLISLNGQFRKPAWPGDTIITEGWREADRVLLRASTTARPHDYIFSNAYAEVR